MAMWFALNLNTLLAGRLKLFMLLPRLKLNLEEIQSKEIWMPGARK